MIHHMMLDLNYSMQNGQILSENKYSIPYNIHLSQTSSQKSLM